MTQLGNYLRGALRKASKVLAVLAEDGAEEPRPAKPTAPTAPAAPAAPVCCDKPMNELVSPDTFAFAGYRCTVCGNERKDLGR
jgi:hypothetical protein